MFIPRFGETDFIEVDREVSLNLLQEETPYKASGRIIEVNQAENWFKVKLEDQLEKVERRRFVRVPIERRMKYKLVSHQNQVEQFKSGTTINISTGGIKFKTTATTKIKSGHRIMVHLPFLTIAHQQFQSRVVYRRQNYQEGQSNIVFGAEFLEVTPQLREKLASWLFEKQRILRQQGKI